MSYPAINLTDAVVVITGAGRGIGRATAQAFAERGSTVCAGDLDDSVDDLGMWAGRVDVTSRDSFAAFIGKILDDHGRIDVLVNNAGVMPLGGFLDEPDAVSHKTMDVNLWGPINGMRLAVPGMVERGRGHVVNIASMAGKIPIPGMAVYNASKFAALGVSVAVRRELAGKGVSVSAVLPSAVRTGLASGVPLGGGMPTVDPEDIAAAVVRSCQTRRAEIPVPGYLRAWDLIDALTPDPVMGLLRRLVDDTRALTSVDHAARAAYVKRIT